MKVLISGASSGIGQECAKICLEQGYTVIGLGRDFSKCSIDHSQFYPIEVDLCDLENLPKKFLKLSQSHPDIQTIIFSAGIGLFGYLEQLSNHDIQTLMNTNFISHVMLTKAFLPLLKQKKEGTLIYIGSEAALLGKAQGSIYCASKFALRGFTQALRKECQKSHIRVSLINPGMVKTAFFDPLHFSHNHDETSYCTADEVAKAVICQINSPPTLVFDEVNLSPIKPQVIIKSVKGSNLNSNC